MFMGFWRKGNNPFWNFDSDAAQRDREAHRDRAAAHQEKLDHELELHKQQSRAEADHSKLRIQKNAMQAGYEDQIKKYEAQTKEMRMVIYKLCLRSNVLNASLDELINQNPEMKDHILDIIQSKRDEHNGEENREKWWKFTGDIKSDMEYLKFPYEKREPKK
jgi:hypothetical protein